MKYYNSFYEKLKRIHIQSQEWITNNNKPIEYNGYLLFPSVVNVDIVLGEVKVGECVTIEGCKRHIDSGLYLKY